MARKGAVERTLMGCGALAILGVLAVVLLGLGALLGSGEVEVELPTEDLEDLVEEPGEDEPAQVQPIENSPENAATALAVRLSGPPGTTYSGEYGTTRGGMLPAEGVLEVGPAEYGVETGDDAFGGVSAVFRKNQPAPGPLTVEVLSAGEVVAQGYTSEESDWVEVNWSPQG